MSAIPAPEERAPGYIGAIPRAAQGSGLGLALVVIASAQLMVVLDATIVNVALPHVQRALGFSGSGLEWVVNAYALALGGLLLLGRHRGKRPTGTPWRPASTVPSWSRPGSHCSSW